MSELVKNAIIHQFQLMHSSLQGFHNKKLTKHEFPMRTSKNHRNIKKFLLKIKISTEMNNIFFNYQTKTFKIQYAQRHGMP